MGGPIQIGNVHYSTPPRPRHGAFSPAIADFYGFHGNRKNRGFSETALLAEIVISCENHDFH